MYSGLTPNLSAILHGTVNKAFAAARTASETRLLEKLSSIVFTFFRSDFKS